MAEFGYKKYLEQRGLVVVQWPEFVIYITGGSLSKKLVMNFLDITTTHIFTFKDLLWSLSTAN